MLSFFPSLNNLKTERESVCPSFGLVFYSELCKEWCFNLVGKPISIYFYRYRYRILCYIYRYIDIEYCITQNKDFFFPMSGLFIKHFKFRSILKNIVSKQIVETFCFAKCQNRIFNDCIFFYHVICHKFGSILTNSFSHFVTVLFQKNV